MKTIDLKINGENIAIKVSKWTKRPKANGIYVVATPESIHKIKVALENALNIIIDIRVNDNGLYINESDSKYLEEGTITVCLKEWFK